MRKKGLQSIDFVGGLILFLTLVVYVAFSVINTAKVHDRAVVENTLHQEAWFFSQKILNNITDDGLAVNESKLSYYADCFPGNIQKYTEIRDALNLDFDNAFRLIMATHAIGLADDISGQNYVGELLLESSHSITFVRTNGEYSSVTFDGNPQQYDDNATTPFPGTITLEATNFTIEKIDRSGQYIILTNTTANCGITPALQQTSVGVERYLVKDNQVFKMRLEYW